MLSSWLHNSSVGQEGYHHYFIDKESKAAVSTYPPLPFSVRFVTKETPSLNSGSRNGEEKHSRKVRKDLEEGTFPLPPCIPWITKLCIFFLLHITHFSPFHSILTATAFIISYFDNYQLMLIPFRSLSFRTILHIKSHRVDSPSGLTSAGPGRLLQSWPHSICTLPSL